MNLERKLAYSALIVFYLIMAAAAALIKPILDVLTPAQYLLIRFAIATPFTLILLKYMRKFRLDQLTVLKLGVIALLAQANNLVVYTALSHTTALQASLLSNTTPILVTLAGVFLLKEREEKHEWLGLVISALGSLFILFSPYLFAAQEASETFSLYGNSLLLLHVLIAVVEIVLIKSWIAHVPIQLHASVQIWTGLSLFSLIQLGSNTAMPPVDILMLPTIIGPILYMSILGSVVAYSLYYYGYNRIEASEATLFNYLGPIVYLPLSVFWLGEKVIPIQLLGLIIVVAGVAIAEYHSKSESAINWFSAHFRHH